MYYFGNHFALLKKPNLEDKFCVKLKSTGNVKLPTILISDCDNTSNHYSFNSEKNYLQKNWKKKKITK